MLLPSPPPAPGEPPPATPLLPWERLAVLLSSALSGLGCVLLAGTHARWPELRTRPRQLLLWLSLADLLSAAAYFYGALRDFGATSWDCVAQGALSTFANTSSFFWTVAIALYLYLSIVRGAPGSPALLGLFHAVSWGVPLLITVAAVSLKKIGYDASDVSVGWCWVDINAEDRVLWMLLAARCALRVPSSPLKDPGFLPENICRRQEVGLDPRYLHLSPDLEHRPVCPDPLWLSRCSEPHLGGPSWHWQHVPGGSELHHVCLLYSGGAEQTSLFSLLLAA
ncbi:G-protein coupled receptor 157 isoform X2 [Pogona vitticeps]